MIASTASFARPLAVKQATFQPKKQRNVVMATSSKHNEACPPVLDRRSMMPLMILPALLLAAKPAAAIGKDPRQMAREREARKAKMREALKAKTAANSAPAAAPAPAVGE